VQQTLLSPSPKKLLGNFTLPAIFLSCQFVVRILGGQNFDGHFIGNNSLKNFLSSEILRIDPLGALWGLHTQPPLLNGIYALVLQFSPNENLILQVTWIGLAFFQVWCVFQFVKIISKSSLAAVTISIVYQFIPSIIGFAFWGYNTILIQTLFTSLALGLLLLEKESPRALWFINFSLVGLFLGKAPFSGFIVAPAILLAHIRFMQKTKMSFPKKRLFSASLILIILIQGHYFIDFKQVALSSWGGNSTLRAMVNSFGKEALIMQVGNDKCGIEIIQTQPIGQKLSDFPQCESRYRNMKITTTRAATLGNSNNSSDALLGSIAITDLVKKLFWENNFRLYKLLIGSNVSMGTFQYFMGEAKFSKFSLAYFKENLLFMLSSFLLFLYYLAMALTKQGRQLWRFGIFVITVTIAYMTFSSLMTEIYENDRYKVEANPLYFLLSVWVLFTLREEFDLMQVRASSRKNILKQKILLRGKKL
jgi:hypothetical protein